MVVMDSHDRDWVARDLRIAELIEAALERRGAVFEIVDSSEDSDEAQERIRLLFGLEDEHAHLSQAVLDMQLSRWTRTGRKKIADRAEELRRQLSD